MFTVEDEILLSTLFHSYYKYSYLLSLWANYFTNLFISEFLAYLFLFLMPPESNVERREY